jgi:hypothetical protein
VVSLGALAIRVLPAEDARPPGVAARLASGFLKPRGKTRRGVEASSRKRLPMAGIRARGRASLAGRKTHELWRRHERALAKDDGAKRKPGAELGVHEEAEATRCAKACGTAEGHKVCEDPAPALGCEKRTGCAEPRPCGAGIGDSARVGIERIPCERSLRGTLERVEERPAPRPEDERGARQRKKEPQAKGRRN